MNDLKIQNGKPVDENIRPIMVNGKTTSLEISQSGDGAKVAGDLEVTGSIPLIRTARIVSDNDLVLAPESSSAVIIDSNITDTDSGYYDGLLIDLDKIGASEVNNQINGIRVYVDNVTAVDGANNLFGINATATMGSSPSQTHVETIKDMNCDIVIAYDNDTAGKMGVDKIERMRRELMMPSIKICLPPKAHKDWNEAWRENMDLKQYVHENTRDYDIEYLIETNIESG